MKIAISSQGNDLESMVDPRFGRAKCFILVDTETDQYEIIENTQSLNLPQGAGVQAAQNVLKYKPHAVLTGNCGPKAYQVLNSGNVDVYIGVEGKIKDVIEQFKKGKYQKSDRPNVGGHWM